MFGKMLWLGLSFILIIIWSCASKTPSVLVQEKKTLEAIATPSQKAGWEAEWEMAQKEAKKEGKVVMYSVMGPELRQALAKALKEYGIDLEILSGRGTELAEKLLRERKAGIYGVDFFTSGLADFLSFLKPAGALAPLKPLLILPEVKDTNLWYNRQLPLADKEGTVIVFEAGIDQGIHVNTDIVKPGNINSMYDLIDPRWKGKIITDDPTTSGRGQQWFSVAALRLGEDYIRQLAKQELFITRDLRQLIDWVAKGRYPIGLGVRPDDYQEYKRAGAPVNNIPLKEISYLLGGRGHIAHLDRSPHLNASRVFLNWLLSKEGQILWQEMRNTQSARRDTPLDHLKATGQLIRQEGADYYDARSEDWQLEIRPKGQKIVMDIFKPIIR